MNSASAGIRAAIETREERRERAIAEASRIMAAARQERDELFASAGGGRKGALAVAEAAAPAGTPEQKAAIAEKYLRWHNEERQKRAAGSAA
jgi:hypothetical protein